VMRRRSLPATGSLLLLAALASACSDSASGTPLPQSTPPPATTSTSIAPATSRLLPPRPADLDLTGMDPCKALTEAQGKQLGYDRGWERPPTPDFDYVTNTPNCSYGSSQREFGSIIAFVTTESAETWISDPGRDTGVRPQVTTISEFPALQITVPSSKKMHNNCQIVVDVHDKQYIDVFSDQLVGGHVTGAAPYCAEARRVAAMVLENVKDH
jgi:hypothetical protein